MVLASDWWRASSEKRRESSENLREGWARQGEKKSREGWVGDGQKERGRGGWVMTSSKKIKNKKIKNKKIKK